MFYRPLVLFRAEGFFVSEVKIMVQLQYNPKKQQFEFQYELWGRKLKMRVLSDNGQAVENSLDDMDNTFCETLGDTAEEFAEGLRITSVRINVCEDGNDVYFNAHNRKDYKVDTFWRCVLCADNSFEVC